MKPKKLKSINIATIIVAAKPTITGTRFFLTSSTGLTLHIAATGITPQGIIVPPPTQTAVSCPRAPRPSLLTSTADEKSLRQ